MENKWRFCSVRSAPYFSSNGLRLPDASSIASAALRMAFSAAALAAASRSEPGRWPVAAARDGATLSSSATTVTSDTLSSTTMASSSSSSSGGCS